MIRVKDIEAGKTYCYKDETEVFLVLKKDIKNEYVHFSILWLLGKRKGAVDSWRAFSVYYSEIGEIKF